MSEWKEYKLMDFAEVQTGPFGSQLHAHDYVSFGTPSIMPTNIGSRLNILTDNMDFVSDTDIERLNKYLVKENDIVYSRRGDVEKCAFITKKQSGWLCGTGCLRIRFISKDINPKFCAYYLSTSDIKSWIVNNAVGTTMPNLNSTILGQVPVLLPNISEQTAIAEILSSLDDKIDLLHRQNKTLEQSAETIFRQWFVAEANSNKSMFLDEIVETVNGVSYKSSELNPSKTAMVSLKSFDRNGGFRIDGFKEFTGKYKERQIVAEGDLIVAHTDITQEAEVIGNPALVLSHPNYETLVISMDMVKVLPKYDWVSIEFLYYLMKTREFKGHCEGNANGSTVLHLSKQAISTFEFPSPDKDLVIEFTKQAKELTQKTFLNHKQIKTLTQLRDTLLPKLMSGEVRVAAK